MTEKKHRPKKILIQNIVKSLEYKTIDQCKEVLHFIAKMNVMDVRPYENAKRL
jgi:hypothetical protein